MKQHNALSQISGGLSLPETHGAISIGSVGTALLGICYSQNGKWKSSSAFLIGSAFGAAAAYYKDEAVKVDRAIIRNTVRAYYITETALSVATAYVSNAVDRLFGSSTETA